jgi:hypothetical protein
VVKIGNLQKFAWDLWGMGPVAPAPREVWAVLRFKDKVALATHLALR